MVLLGFTMFSWGFTLVLPGFTMVWPWFCGCLPWFYRSLPWVYWNLAWFWRGLTSFYCCCLGSRRGLPWFHFTIVLNGFTMVSPAFTMALLVFTIAFMIVLSWFCWDSRWSYCGLPRFCRGRIWFYWCLNTMFLPCFTMVLLRFTMVLLVFTMVLPWLCRDLAFCRDLAWFDFPWFKHCFSVYTGFSLVYNGYKASHSVLEIGTRIIRIALLGLAFQILGWSLGGAVECWTNLEHWTNLKQLGALRFNYSSRIWNASRKERLDYLLFGILTVSITWTWPWELQFIRFQWLGRWKSKVIL